MTEMTTEFAISSRMKNALLVGVCAAGLAAPALDVSLQGNGVAAFGDASLAVCIHGEGWRENAEGRSSDFPNAAGTAVFDVKVPWSRDDAKALWAKGTATLVPTADGRAFYTLCLASLRDQKPELTALELRLAADRIVEGEWELSDGRRGVFPKTFDERKMHVFNGTVDWVRIAPKGGKPFTLSFPVKTGLCLQDDRKWVKTFSLRINPVAGRSTGPFPGIRCGSSSVRSRRPRASPCGMRSR